tara:strand:+ start:878 stop:1318 length:441 start_codon:yes stop_codon:yes gene_type:complete
MSLRKAQISDINSIVNIEKTCFKKPYWNESLLKYLFNNSTTDSAWIFDFKKKIIGFLIEQRCLNEISILNVAIDKKYQNNGFGKKIISQYLRILPNNSFVFLEVNKNNFSARKVYTTLNFKEISSRKSYYNNCEDALIMRYVKNSN